MKLIFHVIISLFFIMLLQGCASTGSSPPPGTANLDTQPIATTPFMFRGPPGGVVHGR